MMEFVGWDDSSNLYYGKKNVPNHQPVNPSIPNSESVGFQSLGPGTGDTKNARPEKQRNSPGTLLEPFAVGLTS